MDYQAMVAAARRRINEVDAVELAACIDEVRVIDVRELGEHELGAIPGSILIPRGTLESDITAIVPDQATDIVLYCSVGARSALAAVALEEMGYRTVRSLAGGFEAWKASGGAWTVPESLSSDQRIRYARHIRLPEIATAGQARLLASRVLVVGAGGLGSPAAIYLAAAGVGTIGMIDDDVVDLSNLQRQILHRADRVGQPKVESARQTLQSLNSDVKVEPIRRRLNAGNVVEIMAEFDVVIDGADNFPTRYLINDAALHTRTPVVHASVFRFEGQVSVFAPYQGPCYRCLFPEPPVGRLAASCEEAGVLGVLTGVVGSLQAVETIKLLVGIGRPLVGRLLVYDALTQDTTELRVPRRADCPACGDERVPPTLVDYDEACRPA